MKPFILVFLFFQMVGLTHSQVFKKPVSTQPVTQKLVVKPENQAMLAKVARIENNRIVVSNDFQIKRVDDITVSLISKAKGGIKGRFYCGCSTKGTCKLLTTGQNIYCENVTCKACEMTVVVDGNKFALQ